MSTIFTIGSWSAGAVTPVIDSNQCVWVVKDYKGWAGAPAPRTNAVAREQADGTFDGPVWQPGRVVTIDGTVTCPSNLAMHLAMDVMASVLVAGSRTGTMVVAEPHLTRQMTVRRDAETLCDPDSATTAEFSLILFAADPVRYGSTLQTASATVATASGGRAYSWAPPRAYGAAGTAGLVTITNLGNLTTYPVITISAGAGPLVNPSITLLGGLALVFPLTLNTGDVLTVDTGQRTVTLNGTAARVWPLATGTLGCVPGLTQLLFGSTSADPTASAAFAWRDAYA